MAKPRSILPYLRKAAYILALLVLVAGLYMLGRFHRNDPCSALYIDVRAIPERQLLSVQSIQDMMEQWYPGGLVGLPASELDLATIEAQLRALPAVKRAEVSYGLDAVLRLQIWQRDPIVRIYDGANRASDHYLDEEGVRIPALTMDPARVPIASGVGTEEMSKKVYTLARYVQENDFARALVEQIFVSTEGDLLFVSKIGTHRVVLGDAEDLDSKFYRLKRFYEDGLSRLGWDRYSTINLKFAGQIVCS